MLQVKNMIWYDNENLYSTIIRNLEALGGKNDLNDSEKGDFSVAF